MTGTSVKKFTVRMRADRIGQMLLLGLAAAGLDGCAERKPQAIPWATAVMVRPNPPVARGASAAELADLAPELRLEPPASPGRMTVMRPVPPRSRGAGGSQPDALNDAKTPTLVPELSPQETAVAKAQFNDSMAAAERNLAAARGRTLTAAQTDVISKITGFVAEAREASGEGDWARARNLAKKAQILSDDLVASF